MHLYVNKPSLDFGDIGNIAPTEKFDLETNLGKTISLKIAKFRQITDLTVNYFVD